MKCESYVSTSRSPLVVRALALLLAVILAVASLGLAPASAWATGSSDSSTSTSTSKSGSSKSGSSGDTSKSGSSSKKASSDDELGNIAEGMADGVYYGSGEGYQSTVTVAVTVEDERITDVKVVSHADDAAYIARAEKLIPSIVNQQTADVDTISGVTYSSRGIISAVKDAMTGSGSVSVMNSVWFSVGMIVLAVLLFAAAVMFALRWWKAESRKEKRRANRLQRWCVQGMFFLLAPSAFATGFMGLKTLLMQINVMNTHRGYDFEVMSFTILLIVLLLAVVLLGRFFCGYVCGFGLLGDALYKLSDVITSKLGIKRPTLPRVAQLVLRSLKYVVLVVVCVLVLMGFYKEVNADSPWTMFGKLVNFSGNGLTLVGIILLVLVCVLMMLKERAFCEYFCPLGALYSLVPTLFTGRMRRQRPKCVKNCSNCLKVCPVDIEPKQKLLAGECIECGECAEGCPVQNITLGLEVRAEELKEMDAPSKNLRVLLTSRPVSVLWKALLFLLILWLAGATRYLPTLFM